MTKSQQWRFGVIAYKSLEEYPSFASFAMDRREIGLPQRFFHYFTTDGILRPIGSGTNIIGFGYSMSGDHVALEADSGRVVLVHVKTGEISSLVNSSLTDFVDFMQVCESRYPYYDDEGDLDDSEEAAKALRGELAGIDPDALEPGTYWSDFISDVANGNYT